MDNQVLNNVYCKSGRFISNVSAHAHNNYQILFIKKGIVDLCLDEKNYHIDYPCAVLLNCFERHSITHSSDDYVRVIIELSSSAPDIIGEVSLSQMLKFRPAGTKFILKLDDKDFLHLECLTTFLLEEFKKEKALSSLLTSNITVQILINLYRLSGVSVCENDPVLMIQQYIDKNFKDLENLDTIAKHFNISYSVLSHNFKKFTGYSPMSYIIYSKLNYANHLLLTTDLNVSTISAKSGFSDINNFIRQFKNMFSLTPFKYRKKYKFAVN